ncbi:uncharacterized protein LOC116175908 [Photinus pyralis]|uniref:uncharacterized protein LOC116175908 n=1 Tax=Photinus pyralis TaxID=7054 RepID=UPI0012673869|nr:uncharacterized protein LOC116175908 [Photinus pyralis]
MQLVINFLLVCIGGVLCDQPNLATDLESIQNKINEIPGLEHLDKDVPSQEEILNVTKWKCEQNGGPLAFENLMAAKDEIQKCIEDNFDFSKIESELSEKRKTGSMDDVFVKYCGKKSVVDACMQNFTEAVSPCLENVEKSSLKLLLNITDNLIDFGCHKDGDRIAMFLAEGGLECLRNKTDGIEDCFNKTIRHRIPQSFALTALPLFAMNDDGCDDFSNLHKCVTGVLETCTDHTPANLVDAAFKYTLRSTPCKDRKRAAPAGTRRRIFRRDTPSQELFAIQHAYDKLKQKFEPHCLQNGGQKAANEFREALTYVERCQNQEQTKFMRKNEEVRGISYDYMCKEFRQGLRGCLSNLTKKMEVCSNPAEKYVPKFGLEMYDSVFNYKCKDDARALKMLFGEQDICTKTILGSTDVCIGKTKHIRDYSKEAVVTKTELCSDMKLLRNCFRDMVSQHCPNNNNVNDLVKGLSDAIYAPCASCGALANLALTLALVILSRLF